MNIKSSALGILIIVSSVFVLSACVTTGKQYKTTAHWKEAVPLHDGSELIVDRVVKDDPRGTRELFQGAPRAQVITTFTLPVTGQKVEWVSDFTRHPDENDLTLLAVDIIDGMPYIATASEGCQGMNIWGHPNPPQVFFKYVGGTWQRIPVTEFPHEITSPNVMVNVGNLGALAELFSRGELIDNKIIQKKNERLRNPRYQDILRKPISAGLVCKEKFYAGNYRWEMIRGYKATKSLEECLKRCEIYGVRPQNCPCDSLFKQEKRNDR